MVRGLALEDVDRAVVGDEEHEAEGRDPRDDVEPRVQLQPMEEAGEPRAERILRDPQQQQPGGVADGRRPEEPPLPLPGGGAIAPHVRDVDAVRLVYDERDGAGIG